MTAEDAGRAAISDGEEAERREVFDLAGPKAVATDVQELVAAAYVVTHLADGEWKTDILTFARVEDVWEWRSEGGSGRPDLPLEREVTGPDGGLGAVDTTMAEDDDHQFVSAAGFASAGVSTVELTVGDATRRVTPIERTGAFVAALILPAGTSTQPDEIDVRALDKHGSVLDSTAAWRAQRRAEMPDTISVAAACAALDGTHVTVRASLLVLEGQPVRLCDGVDAWGDRPEPDGPSLIVHGMSASTMPLSWTPEAPGVNMVIVVMSGTVEGGQLHPGP